jgi:signal transduction histidine kinase
MRRVSGLRTPPSEVALATVVTIVMAADVQQAAHPLPALLLVLVAGSTLAWRLAVPELPLLLICATDLVLRTTAPGPFGPQTVVLGVMVAGYAAAVHLAGRRALVAGGISLVLIWWTHVGSAEGEAADFLPFVVWGAPWLVGRLARRQALQARADGARAAALLAAQEAQTREAAQQERDRIARELHDVVAHAVSVMVVQAGAERLARPDSPSRDVLLAVEKAGRQALVELRAMLGVLRTSGEEGSDPAPDLRALPALVDHVRSTGLPVELHVSGDADVPAGLGLSAYRVVQEALTNVLRHAGEVPTRVSVDVAADAAVVEVRSELPAAGRTPTPGSGRGLTGMRERVALHDGTLTAGQDGAEWVVRARLPLVRRGAA